MSLRDWLKHPESTDALQGYRFLSEQGAPLDLVQNLLNVANGKHYHIRPFIHLKKGSGLNATWPTQQEKVEALIESTKTSGFSDLSEQIAGAYRLELLATDQPSEAEKPSLSCEIRAGIGGRRMLF